MHDC